MKTQVDESKVPRFEDLVFEGRNKEYGAYAIREKYNSTVNWAILLGIFLASGTVIVPFVKAKISPPIETKITTTVIAKLDDLVNEQQIKTENPVKPKIEVPREVFQPIVVDSTLSNQNQGLPITEDIINETMDEDITAIDTSSRVEIDKDIFREIEEPVLVVDEEVMFGNGGVNEFRRWIKENLIYPPIAIENQIQGRVYVQFVVEKDGSVSNIIILKSDDPALDKEAVRVVKASPKWSPAKRQGRPVRKLLTIPIIFKLNQQ